MADPYHFGRVEIVPYDSHWPDAYRTEAADLCKMAGGLFVQIEHVGSTAIPDLSAKPTIDIMAATPSFKALDGLVSDLAERGYREFSEQLSFRRFFRKEASGGRPSYHLHVVPESAWQDRSERLFRDWLLTHPAAAEEYGRLKHTLAKRFGSDREGYTTAKSDFIRGIVGQARHSLGLEPLTDWTE